MNKTMMKARSEKICKKKVTKLQRKLISFMKVNSYESIMTAERKDYSNKKSRKTCCFSGFFVV